MTIRICLLLILFGAMGSLRAQHHHYMFIQADQQQPFYVKMGKELLSSSRDGFLIIPRLKDSAYEMIIGFPENKFPEYRFRFASFKKDRGMALKNFQEKGWGLFDYQTMDVQMGEKQEAPPQPAIVPIPPPITSDVFTAVLASVISDPGLLATPLIATGDMQVSMASNAVARTSPEPTVVPKKDPLPKEKDTVQVSAVTVPSKSVSDSAVVATATDSGLKPGNFGNQPFSKSPEPAKDSAMVVVAGQPSTEKQGTAVLADGTVKETVVQAAPPLTITPSEDSIRLAAQSAVVAVNEPANTKPSEPVKKKKSVGAMFAGTFKKKEKTAEPVEKGAKESGSGGDLAYKASPSPQINSSMAVSDSFPTLQSSSADVASTINGQAASDSQQTAKQAPISIQADNPGNPLQEIRLESEARQESGLSRIYIDATGELQMDTVDIFIPFDLPLVLPAAETKSMAIEQDRNPKKDSITAKSNRNEAPSSSTAILGSGKKDRADCRRMATQADMRALRKKMVAISDEDEMVMAALKDIKVRCYTTIQVRDICAVFTRDEGRYKLIDAAYPYVFDPSQYETLEFLLTDKYFVHRFKALIEK